MTNYEKLINTLKEVFMLDKAELDFGIYRIMNQKRKDIEQFLEVDLVPQVQKVLSESLSIDKQAIQKELDDAINQLIKFKIDPETSEEVQNLKKRLGEAADMVSIENEVFSLLANFFKRYFDNGDFISMRRYKKDVYAIPYEGEEVKLHWANADQYYIKTSEYFKVYRFKLSNGKTVAFELIEASTEQNNNKAQGDKERRFAIYTEKVCEVVGDEFKIYFTYEPADKKVTQKELLENAFDAIKTKIPNDFFDLLSLRPTEKDKQRTLLQKHLLDYTARNTFDYFIHKDLGGFLTRELDFYIKNEVLFIDDLNTKDEQEFLKQLSKIKAIKKIGEKIITFLAQLENFQKKLWLKKKMVVECNYCITLDRVPNDLYPEILNNQAQIQEWVKLFAIDEIKAQEAGGLFPENKVGFSIPITLDFLNQNQFLVLDTAFFSEPFKWKLIGSIEKFDEQCDGLMINADNFHALNLLQKRYESQVKCTYIDPPYNTGNDGFTYKDNFKSSSWLSFMNDKILLANELMEFDAALFISIDDNEVGSINTLLKYNNPRTELITYVAAQLNPRGRTLDKYLAKTHEYIATFAVNGSSNSVGEITKGEAAVAEYNSTDKIGKFRPLELRNRNPVFNRGNRPNLYYPIYINPDNGNVSLIQDEIFTEQALPQNSKGEDGCWTWGKDKLIKENNLVFGRQTGKGEWRIFRKDYLLKNGEVSTTKVKSIWVDKSINNENGKELIGSMFGSTPFSFPKPVALIQKCLEVGSNQSSLILDYFSGSGTTGHSIIELNREDNGNRKYILVEMGEYFDSVTKPRIQKVVYSKDWKDGKPVSREGISHCFKYMRLESYEDTLNNLTLKQTVTQQKALEMNPAFKEGYMLNYMLDLEAKDSLLNLEWFVNPFNCYLNITKNNELQPTKVDLVETFNYLIGLVVESYATPKEGYLVVTGKNLAGESILVVWRDCTQHNSAALNEFLAKSTYNPLDSEYDRIFVNGDNNVENLKTGDERWKVVLIEEEFGKRMFENS
jgi:adenine-specific DNA-methyltransferase